MPCARASCSNGFSRGIMVVRGVQGDVKKLTDDVAALKPTLFVAVPRVLERIQQGIQGRLRSQSPVVQFAFQAAYSWKRFWMSWGWSASDVSPQLLNWNLMVHHDVAP